MLYTGKELYEIYFGSLITDCVETNKWENLPEYEHHAWNLIAEKVRPINSKT